MNSLRTTAPGPYRRNACPLHWRNRFVAASTRKLADNTIESSSQALCAADLIVLFDSIPVKLERPAVGTMRQKAEQGEADLDVIGMMYAYLPGDDIEAKVRETLAIRYSLAARITYRDALINEGNPGTTARNDFSAIVISRVDTL